MHYVEAELMFMHHLHQGLTEEEARSVADRLVRMGATEVTIDGIPYTGKEG